MIKVVNIINNLEIGGAEKALITQLSSLKQYKDIKQYVVSLEGHGPLQNEVEKLGIECKNFNYKLFRPYISRFDFFVRIRLLIYLIKIKPDIIHGHLLGGEDIAKVSAAILRIPVVNTVHDVFVSNTKKSRYLNRYLSATIAVSNNVKEYLIKKVKMQASKVFIVPNTVDFNLYKNNTKRFKANEPVFIYVGRIWREKGLKYAADGLSMLRGDYPNLKLLIYGPAVSDADLLDLEEHIRKNKYDFVEIMGPVLDATNCYTKGDIFILPSRAEGFSIALLEAAASKKAILSTRVGISEQIVVEGENGYFIEFNSPKSVYESAKKILKLDLIIAGEASYLRAKKLFSSEEVGRKIREIYYLAIKRNQVED
jgi:glycosyltransferase involved in cell wall biosynthesis